MSVMVRIWLSILLLAAGSYTVYAIYRQSHHEQVVAQERVPTQIDLMPDGIEPATIAEVGKLQLIERSGRTFELNELAGQVWIGSFFFSSCPHTCRQLNTVIASLQQEMADKPVKFLSITVDPENDTPEVLRKYADDFGADPQRWLFLTGEYEPIRIICQRYFKLPIEKKKNHTERLTVVDRRGQPSKAFHALDPLQIVALKKHVDELLAEPLANPPAETTSEPKQ